MKFYAIQSCFTDFLLKTLDPVEDLHDGAAFESWTADYEKVLFGTSEGALQYFNSLGYNSSDVDMYPDTGLVRFIEYNLCEFDCDDGVDPDDVTDDAEYIRTLGESHIMPGAYAAGYMYDGAVWRKVA